MNEQFFLFKSEKSLDSADPYVTAVREAFPNAQVDIIPTIVVTPDPAPATFLFQQPRSLPSPSTPTTVLIVFTSSHAPAGLAGATFHDTWKDVFSSAPVFVVGEATALAIRKTFDGTPLFSNIQTPNPTTHSNNAEGVCETIIEQYNTCEKNHTNVVVYFFCGDNAKDTITQRLQERSFVVHPVITYRTEYNITDEDVKRIVSSCDRHHATVWLVLFSSKIAETVVRRCERSVIEGCRVSCIGATTANTCVTSLNVRVDAIAAKPTPSDLCLSIAKCM
eukprot:PhF_6_TR13516/c0_g1_i1/m.21597/K01719/hemD, UROS; uroporphyrinogen-III synthase